MKFLDSVVKAGTGTSRFVNAKSPELLLAFGAVTFVGAIVSACVATVKEQEVLSEHMDNMIEVRENEEVEDKSKATAKVYFETVIKTAKLYAPPVILATLSLTAMITSNRTLKRRNIQLASAYTALEAFTKKYRAGVIERYGEEADYEIAHGAKKEAFEEKYEDEKGRIKSRKVMANVLDGKESLYTRYFTKVHPEWTGSDIHDDFFFDCVEKAANDKLIRSASRSKDGIGFLDFNEVLDALHFDKTEYGMVTGWIYDSKDPANQKGDGRVVISRHKEYVRNQYGEVEKCWILDFNVDGNIYEELMRLKGKK